MIADISTKITVISAYHSLQSYHQGVILRLDASNFKDEIFDVNGS